MSGGAGPHTKKSSDLVLEVWVGGGRAGTQARGAAWLKVQRQEERSRPGSPGTSQGVQEALIFLTKVKLRCQNSLSALSQGSPAHPCFGGGTFFSPHASPFFNKNNYKGFKALFFHDISALRSQQRIGGKECPLSLWLLAFI